MSEFCWRSGVPIEREQEGENRSFRDRKGEVFPACEPRKGHLTSIGAKGQECSPMKSIFHVKSMGYKKSRGKTRKLLHYKRQDGTERWKKRIQWPSLPPLGE